MSLTGKDFEQIEKIVDGLGKQLREGLRSAVKPLATKDEIRNLATREELQAAVRPLATKADVDRSEARILTGMGLLQRDSLDRLDDHEQRITKLEQAKSRP